MTGLTEGVGEAVGEGVGLAVGPPEVGARLGVAGDVAGGGGFISVSGSRVCGWMHALLQAVPPWSDQPLSHPG